MKSDDIKKIDLSHRSSVETKDRPLTRRYDRMPGVGNPKGERRKKLKSESRTLKDLNRTNRRITNIRTLALLSAAIVVLGVLLALGLKPDDNVKVVNSVKFGGASPFEKPIPSENAKFPPPTSEQALSMVSKAIAVRDPEKVAEFFRPCSSTPQEIIDFLAGSDARDGPVDRLRWLSTIESTKTQLEGVSIKFKGEKNSFNRMVLLTPDAAGKWQIDFDAFARRVTPSWKDLLENQAPSGVVRVYIEKDIYYNGPFLDEEKWICYALVSPELDETLRGYCKIGSPQAEAVAWMLSKEAKFTRTTLEIRRVEGAEKRQFEISKVLAEDWVLGPTPFDETFK